MNSLTWVRRSSVLAAVTAALMVGTASQASAAEPRNLPWLYTYSGSGAVFFDADLAGYPGEEKITVCDNRSDGRGVEALLTGTAPDGSFQSLYVNDPSNNGTCAAVASDYFAEGTTVDVQVYEYWGGNYASYNYGYGVA